MSPFLFTSRVSLQCTDFHPVPPFTLSSTATNTHKIRPGIIRKITTYRLLLLVLSPSSTLNPKPKPVRFTTRSPTYRRGGGYASSNPSPTCCSLASLSVRAASVRVFWVRGFWVRGFMVRGFSLLRQRGCNPINPVPAFLGELLLRQKAEFVGLW